ncbi:MAG: hypothetical protein CMN34_00240 [Saprospirales bacterium]|nr:hypothetical protein [Saprospirales bacterium]|tara:strand:- start:807 stop:1775 length:969 start_codon:yes stop_codon:yes gene_type:complete
MKNIQVTELTAYIKSALLGVAVGDALGVPVEFTTRDQRKLLPVKEMKGNGTHYQVKGTWSDDSSLTFCLAEGLCRPAFDLRQVADNFVRWRRENYWTARGSVFDIGNTTKRALQNIQNGEDLDHCGLDDEYSNGNGALMRILPLVFYTRNMSIENRFLWTKRVASLTHGHAISVLCCFYYLEFALQLIEGRPKVDIYKELQGDIPSFFRDKTSINQELVVLNRLLTEDISAIDEKNIYSGGYVVHTLEASIWCLLTTDNYADSVLRAVNLGWDTDTTGAVTGGLAGLLYGESSIPKPWLTDLAQLNHIIDLAERMAQGVHNA